VPIRHYDAYRLGSPCELDELGFQEALSSRAVLVVEWADRVESLLPADRLLLELSFAGVEREGEGPGDGRLLRFSSSSDAWAGRLASLGGACADNEQ
jgi:tRNA A37 threonylcarbamoyladenosine biosynthesis protein TsaE